MKPTPSLWIIILVLAMLMGTYFHEVSAQIMSDATLHFGDPSSAWVLSTGDFVAGAS
jgi:hypothetical protein